MKSLLTVACVLICFSANARIVTLTTGGDKTNASIVISTNEAFRILSGRGGGGLSVYKDGIRYPFDGWDFAESSQSRPWAPQVVFAGPAVVSLSLSCVGCFQFVTLEILPDSFAPDKTLVLPQGNKANIVLESSTNLVSWTEVAPGAFTNNPVNLFFRIRADHIP